jgi:acetoacetate decarboxylase
MSTHAFNKKCAIPKALVSTRVATLRGSMRYLRAAQRARRKQGPTHNMPEKHQQLARPNKTLKIIGTAIVSYQHELFLPSRCIDHQHIMRAAS